MNTGQETRGRAGVVAAAIAELVAVVIHQAGKHHRIFPERFERLQDARELEVLAGAFRRPMLHDRALRDIGERQPGRLCAADAAGRRQRRNHGVQHREGNRRSQTSQEGPSWQVLACDDHVFPRSPFRIWKGRLLTISRTRFENR